MWAKDQRVRVGEGVGRRSTWALALLRKCKTQREPRPGKPVNLSGTNGYSTLSRVSNYCRVRRVHVDHDCHVSTFTLLHKPFLAHLVCTEKIHCTWKKAVILVKFVLYDRYASMTCTQRLINHQLCRSHDHSGQTLAYKKIWRTVCTYELTASETAIIHRSNLQFHTPDNMTHCFYQGTRGNPQFYQRIPHALS